MDSARLLTRMRRNPNFFQGFSTGELAWAYALSHEDAEKAVGEWKEHGVIRKEGGDWWEWVSAKKGQES